MTHLKPALKRPSAKRMRHSVRLTPSPPKSPNTPKNKTSKNANAKANANANAKAKANANANAKAKANANAKAMANRMKTTTERGKMSANMRKILSRRVLP